MWHDKAMKRPHWIVWVILCGALVLLLDVTALVVWLTLRRPTTAPIVYAPSAHPTAPWRGTARFEETGETRKLPPIKRNVPVFDARLLDGCSRPDLDAVETKIHDAVEVGAPLYNDGDFEGCYRTYEAAAVAIESTVHEACKGPGRALRTGRERASKLSSPAEQAWAMRDTFDGLLAVIDRKGPEL
jgi:serine protease Do